MPLCFGRVGVGAREQHHAVERCAPDVQIFWPLMMKSSPSATACVCSDARSEPEPGSLKPWHQKCLAGQDAREVLALLLLGAVDDDRRPGESDGEEVRPRRRGARHLLVEDELLHHREAGAAVLLRPRRRHPAALRQRPQPVALALVLADADAEDRIVGGAQVARHLGRRNSRTSVRNAASSGVSRKSTMASFGMALRNGPRMEDGRWTMDGRRSANLR